MSFILNALKQAENKSLEKESVKINKQVLVLKKRTRKKRLKIVSLFTVLLATLLGGWLLGSMQDSPLGHATDVATTDRSLDNKKVVPSGNEQLSERNMAVAHTSSANNIAPINVVEKGGHDRDIQNREYEKKAVNPPVPVRTVVRPVQTEIKGHEQEPQEQPEVASVTEPLQNYSDLPFLLKQKLPPLKISLHFYNSNPARRIVRINGKILHENDSIADGLTVEEIKSTTTVLNFDGYLFELNAPGG